MGFSLPGLVLLDLRQSYFFWFVFCVTFSKVRQKGSSLLIFVLLKLRQAFVTLFIFCVSYSHILFLPLRIPLGEELMTDYGPMYDRRHYRQ